MQMSSGTCDDLTVFSGTRRQAGSKSPRCSRLAKGTHASCYTALFILSACLAVLSAAPLVQHRGSLSRGCNSSVVSAAPSMRKLLVKELQSRWSLPTAGMCRQVCGTGWEDALLWTGPKMPREGTGCPFQQVSASSSRCKAALPVPHHHRLATAQAGMGSTPSQRLPASPRPSCPLLEASPSPAPLGESHKPVTEGEERSP